jgi:hypothetical protein
MWRWLLLIVVVIALSAGGTIFIQYYNSLEKPYDPGELVIKNKPDGPLPFVSIEGDLTHKFGVMSQDDEGTHEWVVKNIGEGDLKLMQGTHTCSCTIASLKDEETAVVKPGESTTVKLRWETRKNDGAYEKSSNINTNDPQHPEIKFAVSGTVRQAIVRLPQDETLDFHTISNDKSTSRPLMVFSPNMPEMKIQKVTSRRPELVSVNPKPATPEELKELNIKGGYKLDITITPGNNLGTFTSELILETDHPKKREMVIPLVGKIVGPIAASPEGIRLSQVRSREGSRSVVMLTVHDQPETTFEVEEKPTKLQVSVAPMQSNAPNPDAKVRQYAVSIVVPPGTPPGPILGHIVLKTNHPKAAHIKVPVDIIVQGQG